MSNRFDHTVNRKLESKPDAAIDAVIDVRRNELITAAVDAGRWSSDDKARIMRESLRPGASVWDLIGPFCRSLRNIIFSSPSGTKPGRIRHVPSVLYDWRCRGQNASPFSGNWLTRRTALCSTIWRR
jgi:hypothetical protein